MEITVRAFNQPTCCDFLFYRNSCMLYFFKARLFFRRTFTEPWRLWKESLVMKDDALNEERLNAWKAVLAVVEKRFSPSLVVWWIENVCGRRAVVAAVKYEANHLWELEFQCMLSVDAFFARTAERMYVQLLKYVARCNTAFYNLKFWNMWRLK